MGLCDDIEAPVPSAPPAPQPAVGKKEYKDETVEGQTVDGAVIVNCEVRDCTLWNCKMKTVQFVGANMLHNCVLENGKIGGRCTVRGGRVSNCEFAAGSMSDLIDCKTSVTRVSGTVKLSGGSFEWSEVEATGRVENETGVRKCAVSHVEGSAAWITTVNVSGEPPAVGKKEYKDEEIVGQAINGAKIENCEVRDSTLWNCKIKTVEFMGVNTLHNCVVKDGHIGGQCTVIGGNVNNCEFTVGGVCDIINCKISMTRVSGTVRVAGGSFEWSEVLRGGLLEDAVIGGKKCKVKHVDRQK
eukprot:TRINITY_DN5648_c0_g1_i1.p2 TRINITY_DN5648_c0_g1~~TRINITY_DN5648_c0_g1_i1.p2  ORF type:complete len:299 (+),score=103.79 TRINITY_DN5648_c0_g1_i1:67-963(+)